MAVASFIRATASTLAGTSAVGSTSAMQIDAGGFIFASITHYTTGINVSAVTDTVGNTYLRAGTVQGGDANQDHEIWYTPDPIAAGTSSNSVRVGWTGSAAFRDIAQLLFSWGGVTSISYHAEAAHVLDSGSAISSASVALLDEGLLLGSYVAFDYPVAVSSDTGTLAVFTPGVTADMAVAYRIVTASATTTITIRKPSDSLGRYSVIGKSFYGVTGGTTTAAVAPITIPLMGAGQG